jgi:AAA family ATP:ADP antiporter
MSALLGLVDVRPEERRNTFASFATLLVLTSGHTLLETSRDALFLTRLPAAHLPWMYLAIAVLALGASRLHLPANKVAIILTTMVGALLTAGLWAYGGSFHWNRPWLLYVLYIWSGLFASWVTVQIWTLLGRAHTMTQAKRLYGFIGAGAVLGGVVGAFGARAVLMMVSGSRLILVSAGFFLLSTLPLLLVRIPDAKAKEPTAEQSEAATGSLTTNATLLASDIFARRILVIVLTATIAVTLADFLFKSRVADAYHDTKVLATWLSTFYAVTNTVALVAQIVIGPWIFRTFGVQRALFFVPVLLLGAAGGVLFSGGALLAAVMLKGLDGSLRYSVHKTSMELLLVPVPDGTRERVKPIIELVGNRGGQAIASLAILGLVAIGASNVLTIGAIIVILTVLWLANVITIRTNYLDVFRETLRSGGLSGKAEIPDLDLGALELLFAGLNSSYDVEVLASLDLLAEQHRERLIPALILYHPSRQVVLRALDMFTHRGRTDFVSIADRLNKHPDRAVAAAALRARTAVAPDRTLLEERLEDTCPQVSVTALVALMAREWIDGAEFDRRIKAAIEGRSWQTAVEIVRAIRDLGTADVSEEPKAVAERFDEALIRIAREAGTFRDEPCGETPSSELAAPGGTGIPELAISNDARVRLEVASAMCARKRPGYLPVLVGMLNRHELRASARDAIAAIPGAVDFVDEVMSHRDFARDVRIHLPRTMVLFEPAVAAKKLLGHLVTEKDGAVRFKILRALIKLRRQHPKLSLDEAPLRRAAETTLDHAEELRKWKIGLTTNSRPQSAASIDPLQAAHHLLVDLVRDKEQHATQRLFMLLELLYAEDFEDIERGLRSKKPKTRASSLELVENIVQPPLRTRVLGLVGDDASARIEAPRYEAVLREMLSRGGSTMRTLAEYRAIELGIDPTEIVGRRSTQQKAIDSLGKRLVDKAKNLLPEPTPGTPSNAPA